jgi:hypothetical protein
MRLSTEFRRNRNDLARRSDNRDLQIYFFQLCDFLSERPPVANGGDGLHMRRVAANVFDNQSWTANKG